MLEVTAYHEAGHALVALLAGAKVRSLTIDPDWDDGPARTGDTQIRWSRRLPASEYQRRAIQVALAGPVAEMLYTGDPFHPAHVAEWQGDWRDAWQLAAGQYPGESQRMQALEQVSIALYRQLNSEPWWSMLAALADELLAHETLESEQIQEILEPWWGDQYGLH